MYDKIWLAGLGAFARYEKLGKEGRKLFDELVLDGEEVKDRATGQVEGIKGKAQTKIDEVVGKLKEFIGAQKEETSEMEELRGQIEELTKAVKELSKVEKKPARAPRKKAVAKKGEEGKPAVEKAPEAPVVEKPAA